MIGHTIKERVRRREELATEKSADNRTTEWLDPTDENKAWLMNEVLVGKSPGHGKRRIITDKDGRLALARVV